MNKTPLIVGGIILALLAVAFVMQQNKPQNAQNEGQKKLVIYSGRKEALILPIIEEYKKQTGIEVTVKSGSSEELVNIILQEKDQTQVDVYIGTDASLLEKLHKNDVLIPVESENLSKIPAEYKSKDGTWTGVSGRARVLIANTDMVTEADYPDSVYDLTEDKWNGKVAMAKTTNESVITHLSAIKMKYGEEFLREFLNGLQANDVTMLGGHTDVRQAVARGEFPIGFVNHYYGHLQQQESDNITIIYPDQGEGQDGAFVNVSGAGIVKYGKNTKEAQEFIHFLLSDSVQKQFAELNYEFPLTEGVTSENTKNLGEFKQMDISLHDVAVIRDETIQFIKELGM